MLTALAIRDFVLIDALNLDLGTGFTSLTGETGAGKSILLDALSLALGDAPTRGQVRRGAERAVITATFEPPAGHPARLLAEERGLASAGEPLVLRRVLPADGPARAFLNDQATSAALLSELGGHLVEVHGQHASVGLLNVAAHRGLLDAYAGTQAELTATAEAWRAVREADTAVETLARDLADAARQREFIAHAATELTDLGPEPGEMGRLTEQRAFLQSSEKILDGLAEAEQAFKGDGPEGQLSRAARALDRATRSVGSIAPEPGSLLEALTVAQGAVERALIEVAEAQEALRVSRARSRFEPDALERIEARFFALKSAGRKFNTDPDGLAELLVRYRTALESLEESDSHLTAARKAAEAARATYTAKAAALAAKRAAAGLRLAQAVAHELIPLKLDKARFQVKLDALPPAEHGPQGVERVVFEVATNPGAAFGPLNQIASGGELARFALALKVCLAEAGSAQVLIFDEADQGVGGAVAAAVGERLARLAVGRQVMAVTHSPQVAARADSHLRIAKAEVTPGDVRTRVTGLEGLDRLEEVARMLAGAEITDEARAAARALLGPRLQTRGAAA
jgi:DNA repair protein RecN (Recombination protein N)